MKLYQFFKNEKIHFIYKNNVLLYLIIFILLFHSIINSITKDSLIYQQHSTVAEFDD